MRCSFYKFEIIIILFTSVLFSCSNNHGINLIDNQLEKSNNGLDDILNSLNDNKVVFIGESDHKSTNIENFLSNETVEKLYSKGVRYIFYEGTLFSENSIKIYYPWENVGVYYNPLKKTINPNIINKIKFIPIEKNRIEFIPGTYSSEYLMNYRDEYMFKIVKLELKNSLPEEKAIIICGTLHGIKKEIIYYDDNNSFSYKPLGVYLNEEFSDNYYSYNFLQLDTNLESLIKSKKIIDSQKWNEKNFPTKCLDYQQIIKINNLIPVCYTYPEELTSVDSFLVDKFSTIGIKYGYALNDKKIFEIIKNETSNLASDLSQLNYRYDYDDVDLYYKISDFIINIYYLKLAFGEKFDYDFWNPKNRLVDVLKKLEFNDIKPYYKNINYTEIAKYQEHLKNFYLLKYSNSKTINKKIYHNYKNDFIKTNTIFPHDIWCIYWNLKMLYKIGNYKRCLEYCNNFIENKLAFSCQVLPEVLTIAISCSKKINKNNEKKEYLEHLKQLKNEFNIDVTKFDLFLY